MNECVQELLLRKLLLIENILDYNQQLDTLELSNMTCNELSDVLEYYELRILEAYKRRNLTPIQFAKEKDGKLKERLEMWQEKLKTAKEIQNKERIKIANERIKQVKLLIDANKKRMDIEKEREK